MSYTTCPFNAALRVFVWQDNSGGRASDTSFQVKWVAKACERGSVASTSRWTAILTVTVKPPNNADTLRKNPLGLYVNAIDWSRELDAPGSKSAPPTPITTPAPPQSNIPPGSPTARSEERRVGKGGVVGGDLGGHRVIKKKKKRNRK